MSISVTTFWDSRLLYIYALLGGYTQLEVDDVSQSILRLCKRKDSVEYCLDVLAKLEAQKKVEVKDVNVNFSKLDDHPFRLPPRIMAEVSAWQVEAQKSKGNGEDIWKDVQTINRLRLFVNDEVWDSFRFHTASKDPEWFRQMVHAYLAVFQANNIFTPNEADMTVSEEQKRRLLDRLPLFNELQTIKGSQSLSSAKFLETLLSLSEEDKIAIQSLRLLHFGGKTKGMNDAYEAVAVRLKGSVTGTPAEEVEINSHSETNSTVTQSSAPRVEYRSYDAANGVLTIGKPIQIIKQPNKKGAIHESKQARVMRLLFKDVNSLNDGLPMRRVFSVKPSEFTKKHLKLAKSYVKEINEKIAQEVPINELLITSQTAIYVDDRYLK